MANGKFFAKPLTGEKNSSLVMMQSYAQGQDDILNFNMKSVLVISHTICLQTKMKASNEFLEDGAVLAMLTAHRDLVNVLFVTNKGTDIEKQANYTKLNDWKKKLKDIRSAVMGVNGQDCSEQDKMKSVELCEDIIEYALPVMTFYGVDIQEDVSTELI